MMLAHEAAGFVASPSGAASATPCDLAAAHRSERRGHVQAARPSWAVGRPFVMSSDGADARTSAGERRREWAAPYARRVLVGDVVTAAVVLAPLLASAPSTQPYAVGGAMLGAGLWAAGLGLARGYDIRRLGDGPEEFQAILRVGGSVLALLGLIAYSFQWMLPRRDVLVAVPLIVVGTALLRSYQRRWLRLRRSRGEAVMRTLLVGEPSSVESVAADLAEVATHGLHVVGACVPSLAATSGPRAMVQVLGSVSEVPQIAVDHEIDRVIVVGSQLTGVPLRRLAWAVEHTGAELMVAPGLVEITGPNVHLRPAAGLSLLHVEPPSSRFTRMLGKNLLDRILGLCALLVAMPLVAVAAILVKADSQGPAFFRQTRAGLDCRPFTMYKLRTMVADAELRREELLAHSDRDGLTFKMRRDPRVTRAGALLRRYSIDELPQLWNVVRGDMSLVGPRPPLLLEVDQYHDEMHRRLRVRPGLTGLWQVSGRANLSWEASVRLDLRYVDNWSLALDLQILWRTARAVLQGSGAY